MNITYSELRKLGACRDGLDWFREYIGESGDLETCIRAAHEHNGISYMVWAVAENPNTPGEALLRLETDADAYVRRAVARHPNTTGEALLRLATDADADVRWAVAQNPNTPGEALLRLATDADAYVRWAVAENPNTLRSAK